MSTCHKISSLLQGLLLGTDAARLYTVGPSVSTGLR